MDCRNINETKTDYLFMRSQTVVSSVLVDGTVCHANCNVLGGQETNPITFITNVYHPLKRHTKYVSLHFKTRYFIKENYLKLSYSRNESPLSKSMYQISLYLSKLRFQTF